MSQHELLLLCLSNRISTEIPAVAQSHQVPAEAQSHQVPAEAQSHHQCSGVVLSGHPSLLNDSNDSNDSQAGANSSQAMPPQPASALSLNARSEIWKAACSFVSGSRGRHFARRGFCGSPHERAPKRLAGTFRPQACSETLK